MRNDIQTSTDVSQQEIANPASCNCLPRKRTLKYTQKITYTATLTAIALVIKATVQLIFSFLPFTRPTLTYIPWIIAGIILDPVSAAIVGFASDSLGMILSGGGASINPIMTLSCALYPCIVSLCVRYLPLKSVALKALIGTVISTLCCTMGLSTLGLYLWSGLFQGNVNYIKPYYVLLAARLMQLLFVLISAVAVAALLPVIKRLGLLPAPPREKAK